MFIRWKTIHRVKGEVIQAYLCQSHWVNGKATSTTLAYLGSIEKSDIKLKDKREAFRQKILGGLVLRHPTDEDLVKFEVSFAKRIPGKSGALAVLTSQLTNEWYSPPWVIEMARQVLGKIDLDPASNDLAQTWIKSATYYTATNNGLSQPWVGTVWLNPPYTRQENLWVSKVIDEYQSGRMTAAIILMNQSGAGWHKRLKRHMHWCEVTKRIAFINSKGEPMKSPPRYNSFFYLGPTPELFSQVFSPIGDIYPPASPLDSRPTTNSD